MALSHRVKVHSHWMQCITLHCHAALHGNAMQCTASSMKKTFCDAEMTVDVLQISASALRYKNLRQSDCLSPPTCLRRIDSSTPVLVRDSTCEPVSSAWTSEYDREYRPYEQSRYRARVDKYASRRMHDDLKPSTPRPHRSYFLTCWLSYQAFGLLTYLLYSEICLHWSVFVSKPIF